MGIEQMNNSAVQPDHPVYISFIFFLYATNSFSVSILFMTCFSQYILVAPSLISMRTGVAVPNAASSSS